jgi:hypothetical protein
LYFNSQMRLKLGVMPTLVIGTAASIALYFVGQGV